MATRGPPPSSSSSGSVTVTIDPSPSSSAPAAAPPPPETVVLRLKRRAKKVSWKEGTVDNESLGRKSSKKCCIFHKEVPFDEDCSDDEADGGRRNPPGDAGEGTSGGKGGCSSSSHGHDHGHRHHH